MELGLQVPDFALPGGTAALRVELAEAVRAADDAGFAYLAVSAKPFSSKHFTAERLLNSPQPPQRPPIMVGGGAKTVYHYLDLGPSGEKTGESLAEAQRLHRLGGQAVTGPLPGGLDRDRIEIFAQDIIPAVKELA